jgi:hypothetical protein
MPAVIEHVNRRDYERVAVALAINRLTYFGRDWMRISTVTGADNTPQGNAVA